VHHCAADDLFRCVEEPKGRWVVSFRESARPIIGVASNRRVVGLLSFIMNAR
jgi:hypothetical protein